MNNNISRLLRRWRTTDTKSKHNPSQPRAAAPAIPEHLLSVLRRAAEDELERACDNMSNWDPEIRAEVLAAARVVEVFDLNDLSPQQIADLADRALRLPFEDPIPAPTDTAEITDLVALFGLCHELIALRDAAKAQAERGSRS